MLITGGVGFIGVNSATHFLRKGYAVTIFDNFSRRGVDLNMRFLEKEFSDKCKVIKGDIRTDSAVLEKLAEDTDVILHLAAQVAVTTSVTDPRTDFDCNALGTFNVLEAARKSKTKPILLYASTNKVYGGLEHRKVTEGMDRYTFADGIEGVTETEPLDFHSPYGCSKGAADQYVHDYARLYGLRTVVLRQSCIYGPHQFGVEDQGWVAWFLIAAMLKRPVQIYGNGKQVRDVLFVQDLVNLYDLAIQHISIASGQVYNVGGGPSNALSLLHFLSILEKKLKLPLQYSFADWRPGDQPIFISDNTKASRDLGWSPMVGMEDGFAKLLEWMNAHEQEIRSFYA